MRSLVKKAALGQVFLRVLHFSCQYHSASMAHLSLSQLYSCQKDKWVKPENLHTKQCCPGYQGAMGTKILPHCFLFMAVHFIPISAGLKRQPGKGRSIAHASPTAFSPFQKHCHVTCRSLQLLLNN